METIQKDRVAGIALGSNLGFESEKPEAILEAALKSLIEKNLCVLAVSRFFRTPCFPPGSGPDYVNAAAVVETDRDSAAILQLLHETEQEFARTRTVRWGARTLDLDLLWHGGRILPDPVVYHRWAGLTPEKQAVEAPDRLILPHPRLQDRGFVLIPLADVAPMWRHPVSRQTVIQMAAARPRDEIAAISPV